MADATATEINRITHEIIGAAIEVHRVLGPVAYGDVKLDCGYRIDMLVEGLVVVELKSVDRIEKIHGMQVLSYLRLSGLKVGLLINFNVEVLKKGIRRIVNGFDE
jgi:glutamine phosphoribosylpyrophosphate amidotransferase